MQHVHVCTPCHGPVPATRTPGSSPWPISPSSSMRSRRPPRPLQRQSPLDTAASAKLVETCGPFLRPSTSRTPHTPQSRGPAPTAAHRCATLPVGEHVVRGARRPAPWIRSRNLYRRSIRVALERLEVRCQGRPGVCPKVALKACDVGGPSYSEELLATCRPGRLVPAKPARSGVVQKLAQSPKVSPGPNFDQTWLIIANIRPRLAKCRRNSTHIGRLLADVVRTRPTLIDQVWALFGRSRPK